MSYDNELIIKHSSRSDGFSFIFVLRLIMDGNNPENIGPRFYSC